MVEVTVGFEAWGYFYFPERWDLLLNVFLVDNQSAALEGEQRRCFTLAEVSNSKGEGNGAILPERAVTFFELHNRQEADNTQDILILSTQESLLGRRCLHLGHSAFLDILRDV